jgi:hypothetical protein
MDTTFFVKDTTPHVALSSYSFINYEVEQISLWNVDQRYIMIGKIVTTETKRRRKYKYHLIVKYKFFMMTLGKEVVKVQLASASTYSYIRGCVLSNKGGVHNKKGSVHNNTPRLRARPGSTSSCRQYRLSPTRPQPPPALSDSGTPQRNRHRHKNDGAAARIGNGLTQ